MGRCYLNTMLRQCSCTNFTQDLACALASQRRISPACLFLCGASQKTNGQAGSQAEACCPESVPSNIAPARPPCPPPLYRSATETSGLKPETPGPAIFVQLSSFTIHPFGEGMKARSLPPPQNISNFHLSSLRITCLTGAGVQAVLICPFARTLCKQSASYLLCEEGGKKMTLLRQQVMSQVILSFSSQSTTFAIKETAHFPLANRSFQKQLECLACTTLVPSP